MGASNVIDVLGEIARQQHVVLQCRMNMCTRQNGLGLLEGTEEFQVNWDPRNIGTSS